MRKITPALLVAVGLVAASIGLAGPASAATSTDGQLTASDARAKHDDCATIHYRFEPAQANSDWQADITITDPHGHESGWDVAFRGWENGSTLLCDGIDAKGTYQIRADWRGYDQNYALTDSGTSRTTFSFTAEPAPVKASSSVGLAKIKTAHGVNYFRATANRAGHRWANHRLDIQCKLYGSWWHIKAKRTNRSGVMFFHANAGSLGTCRVHSAGNSTTKAANSRHFTAGHK